MKFRYVIHLIQKWVTHNNTATHYKKEQYVTLAVYILRLLKTTKKLLTHFCLINILSEIAEYSYVTMLLQSSTI